MQMQSSRYEMVKASAGNWPGGERVTDILWGKGATLGDRLE